MSDVTIKKYTDIPVAEFVEGDTVLTVGSNNKLKRVNSTPGGGSNNSYPCIYIPWYDFCPTGPFFDSRMSEEDYVYYTTLEDAINLTNPHLMSELFPDATTIPNIPTYSYCEHDGQIKNFVVTLSDDYSGKDPSEDTWEDLKPYFISEIKLGQIECIKEGQDTTLDLSTQTGSGNFYLTWKYQLNTPDFTDTFPNGCYMLYWFNGDDGGFPAGMSWEFAQFMITHIN